MPNTSTNTADNRPTPKRPTKHLRPSDVIDLSKLDPRSFITKRQIRASAYPVSDATLWRRIKAAKFPAPAVTASQNLWRVGDVIAWLEAQGAKEAA